MLGAIIDPIVLPVEATGSVERIQVSQAHGASESLYKRQMSPQCLVVEDEHHDM